MIVLHWIAEMSNPFIITRGILELKGMQNTKLYEYIGYVFAVVFLTLRMCLVPFLLIWVFEGD